MAHLEQLKFSAFVSMIFIMNQAVDSQFCGIIVVFCNQAVF